MFSVLYVLIVCYTRGEGVVTRTDVFQMTGRNFRGVNLYL